MTNSQKFLKTSAFLIRCLSQLWSSPVWSTNKSHVLNWLKTVEESKFGRYLLQAIPIVRGLEQFWDKSVEEEERMLQVNQSID